LPPAKGVTFAGCLVPDIKRPAGAALLLAFSGAVAASPFSTRDQNPLLAGFGLPRAMPARIAAGDEWQFAADFNWGNSAIVQANARENLVVDGETRELRLTLGRGISDRFALQLQLPYRQAGGGNLDGFVDDWHSWFGFSDGPRDGLPSDDYRIAYRHDGVTALDLRSSGSGLADISADVGYEITASENTSVAAWLSVKLPTGDADELTGSGATDASLIVAAERRLTDRWSTFGQAGVSYLGEGGLLADRQRSVVWSGMAGVGFNVLQSLELKLQLDAHSAAFDRAQLAFMGEALILTVGGSYRFAGWQFDAGVSEDVKVDASPDVVFVFGLRRAL
jgi:hypothetical protein